MRLTVRRIFTFKEVSTIERYIKEKRANIRIKDNAPKVKRQSLTPAQRAYLRGTVEKRLKDAANANEPEADRPESAAEQVERSAGLTVDEGLNAAHEMRLMVRFNSAPTAQEQMKRAAIKEKVKEAQTVKERSAVAEATIKTREFEAAKAQAVNPPARERPQAATASSQNKTAAPAIKRGQQRARLKIARQTQQNTQRTKKLTEKAAAAISRALSSAGKAVTEALATGGGIFVAVLIPVIMVVCCAAFLFSSGRSAASPVSAEVNAYTPVIQIYAAEHGIPEYLELIKAVMMQESAGLGNDPMQASESAYNTQYPNTPGGITDPEYSINVGVHALADVLEAAGVESPIDIERISLALQGYNFGPGYISWALANYGEYSQANAVEFSQMMAERTGWTSYGDTQYVDHVLRYYSLGSVMGGSSAMAQVALSQVGNVGGMPYWSWYGYNYRVEWCGCFVSWCAAQCGLLDSGIPKFAYCPTAVRWFQDNGAWQGRDYTPAPGDVIFFDWLQDERRDGTADHVGIVESVESGMVYTVEGNVGDSCVQGQYYIGAPEILGYGVPIC